jgi:hypothetical protein
MALPEIVNEETWLKARTDLTALGRHEGAEQ